MPKHRMVIILKYAEGIMELVKKEIQTSMLRASKYTQLTVDEDFNVPDAMKDIEKVITYRGNVVIEEVLMEEGKAKIAGIVYFSLLYKAAPEGENDWNEICSYDGEIPFQDTVNVDGALRSDKGEVRAYLEDFTISMINSRKFSVRGLIGNALLCYGELNSQTVTRIENGQGIECHYTELAMTKMNVNRKEMLRFKEEFEMPRSKPNIDRIIWHSFALRDIETRSSAGKIFIRGEMELFVIYHSEENELPYQYLSMNREFGQEIEAEDIGEDMISDVTLCLGKGSASVHPDADGEPRNIMVEYVLEAGIKGYQDEKFTIINDMFSPTAELSMEQEHCRLENLLLHNNAKTRVTGKERLRGSSAKILQVCSADGDVEIDNVKIGTDSLTAEGVVRACVVYISDEEDNQFASWNVEIPFEYTMDASELPPDASVRLVPSLDQISIQLLGIDEIEIRAVININLTVFDMIDEDFITGMEILPIDEEKKEQVPGMVGYIVQPGDNLWSIARKFYSTIDSIREINELENEEIQAGDKLIVVKS